MRSFEFLGHFLLSLISLLIIVLTIRVILSWLTLPPTKWLTNFYRFTDPFLDYFRQNFPIRLGVLDLSIIIPFIILGILYKVVADVFFSVNAITVFYPILLLIQIFQSFIHFIITILVIFCVILMIIDFLSPQIYNPIITSFRSIIEPITIRIRKIIHYKGKYADQLYLLILVLLLLISNYLVQNLLRILYLFFYNL